MYKINDIIYFTEEESKEFNKVFKYLEKKGFVSDKDFKSGVFAGGKYLADFGWVKMYIEMLEDEAKKQTKIIFDRKWK